MAIVRKLAVFVDDIVQGMILAADNISGAEVLNLGNTFILAIPSRNRSGK